MSLTPKEILELELPRGFRGYDEQAVDQLLERAAKALGDALAERDRLRAELEARGDATQARDPRGLEQIGDALMTAHRASERLLADARAEVARLAEEAERERAHLLEEAHRRIAALRSDEQDLVRLITSHQRDLVGFVRDAVTRLGPADSSEQVDQVLQDRASEAWNGGSPEEASEESAAHEPWQHS